MISILSGTYRNDNLTLIFSELYKRLLEDKNQEVRLLNLGSLPVSFLHKNSIFGKNSEAVDKVLTTYIGEPDKIVIVSPEYNGSFPGILKAFIDICDPKIFAGKKAALVGVATGRAGNQRGMDHLTAILHYLDVNVLPLKVPISRAHTVIDENKQVTDPYTVEILNKQADRFLQF